LSTAADTSADDNLSADGFAVVVATSRPTVRAFFTELGALHDVSVSLVALDTRSVSAAVDRIGNASIAVLDASVDRVDVLAVCSTLRTLHPSLPICAVFCCAHAATGADLRALLGAGVEGLLDLQLSAQDTLRVLRGVARGQGALHLQLAAGSSTSLVELLASERAGEALSEHELGLLRLVAAGLTDHEIGRQLYLSHHTVKHRIDRLRQRVRARNRIQLAAWAGGQEALRVDRGVGGGPSLRAVDEIPAEG